MEVSLSSCPKVTISTKYLYKKQHDYIGNAMLFVIGLQSGKVDFVTDPGGKAFVDKARNGCAD